MPERSPIVRVMLLAVFFIGLAPLVYFASVETGIAQSVAGAEADELTEKSAASNGVDRYVENIAFGVGERLEFDIKYGFITAGTASMEVKRLIEYNARPAYQIVTRAQSNSFFSSFFKVDDRVESIVDAVGIFSWRFEKKLREGNYKSHRQYEFDQRNHMVEYEDSVYTIPPYVHDALSVLYYVRTQPLEVGKSLWMDGFLDGRQISFEVKVHKKETISVDAGTFECFVVEPISQSVGVFKHEGELKVWLTADRVRMPVLMKSKVLVGSISAELTDYELGKLDAF